MKALKTVFHVHTNYSDDCNTSLTDIISTARREGVRCVTITDHDTIDGAVALSRMAPPELKVIVGEEVSTAEGHLIGLFLREHIEPGLPARRTAELIKAQGGVVIAPHPFNTIFGCSLRNAVYGLVDLLDAVEVCNAQNFLPFPNRKAEAFASEFRIPRIVADVHHRGGLDACYQWIPPFEGPQEFVASLRRGHFVKGQHSLGYFVASAIGVFKDRVGFSMGKGYGLNSRIKRNHGRRVYETSTSGGHIASTGV